MAMNLSSSSVSSVIQKLDSAIVVAPRWLFSVVLI